MLSLFLTSFIFADNIEDTSIIDELNKNKPQVSTSLFKLETFESCNDMQSVMKEYIKLYWENTRQNNYYPVSYKQFENALVMKDTDAISSSDVAALPTAGGGGIDYSETNIQVQGVDESDIIKTD
ncbi:MAG: beta-propeller domain-containing protein [Candidatus Peribacteria bacterium]|nr:beta-propeller domain-containing protein [Candidatus Peribacteria bacterium]